MTANEPLRIGNWVQVLGEDEDSFKMKLDMDSYIAEITEKMRSLEDKIVLEKVIQHLTQKGYTIIPPVPKELCGYKGCVLTPHNEVLPHSWSVG